MKTEPLRIALRWVVYQLSDPTADPLTHQTLFRPGTFASNSEAVEAIRQAIGLGCEFTDELEQCGYDSETGKVIRTKPKESEEK